MVQGHDYSYGITFAAGDDMPPGKDWLFLHLDGRLVLVIREGHGNACVLADAWDAFREMLQACIVPLPVPVAALVG